MGQINSHLEINPNHPVIWLQGNKGKCACKDQYLPLKFPFDQKPLQLRDDALWIRFGEAMDEHLSKIQKGVAQAVLVSIGITMVLLLLFVSWVVYTNPLSSTAHSALLLFRGAEIFLLAAYTFQIYKIASRNVMVDKTIESLVENYNLDFKSSGYSLKYKTKLTGSFLCPDCFPAKRVIIFHPINSSVEPV